MISNPMPAGELPPGARTAPGDDAFGGYDDTGPRPELGPAMHAATLAGDRSGDRVGIRRGRAGGVDELGFQGTDPMGEDQVQTTGMFTRLHEEDQ